MYLCDLVMEESSWSTTKPSLHVFSFTTTTPCTKRRQNNRGRNGASIYQLPLPTFIRGKQSGKTPHARLAAATRCLGSTAVRLRNPSGRQGHRRKATAGPGSPGAHAHPRLEALCSPVEELHGVVVREIQQRPLHPDDVVPLVLCG